LAAITFPHVAVLFLVFKKNKKNRAFWARFFKSLFICAYSLFVLIATGIANLGTKLTKAAAIEYK
jgi:hypothetical protein